MMLLHVQIHGLFEVEKDSKHGLESPWVHMSICYEAEAAKL
jgi:hypothetical protein